MNPNGIRSCHDEGKRFAESPFFDYLRQHKLRIKVARIFNTYGLRIVNKPFPGDAPLQCQPDLTHAKARLDRGPGTLLAAELKRTIACFEATLSGRRPQ